MPELPEVETIRRVLRHNLINETILDIQLLSTAFGEG